ncbi:MAG TPA: T9SS type A sorting domain-containing protein [Prolixibacteraceae bacterium]|nr:T9SS type A sorting domain-containing protein [Prolixibacteraceae bacterium]
MRKEINFCFLLLAMSILVLDLPAQMLMERLDRAAVAIRQDQGYYITWRLLGNEPWETEFNVYRGATRLNDVPVSQTTTFFDPEAPLNSQYTIRALRNGNELSPSAPARLINLTQGANAGYFDIPINRPGRGTNGGNYSPNDASAGDLNGDGQYDLVLKWDPDNAKDNSQSGITDNVYLDGYTLDGEHLWRIDLGPNIRAGAHYTQFLVYDFDGNGKAEIMVKTAPGTKDASGNYIEKGPASTADHTKKYRNGSGYILSGPEYLTVFDGETGRELATAEYWPVRGNVSNWGDNYGNRLDRYNATVAYVDGQRPTAIFQRGYYTRLTLAAWNWRDGELTRAWTFDSNDSGNGAYKGQGNHSIHVIDANGDGLQDIVTGSSVISGTGKGMHTTGMGHGDACHVSFMKKDDPRPMIFMCHESGGHGVSLRYADNGEMVFNNRASGDIGRGCAAELDSGKPGFKFWGSGGLGLYDLEGSKVGSIPSSTNFVIWWDGTLSRNLMNSNRIDQWSLKTNYGTRLLTADDASSNNGSKSTPTLQADLFGDWREEVILRRNSNTALRVYTSTMPTQHKLFTLMHDPVYRVAISWQNSSYNQPPHPGFYLASDMEFPQKAPSVTLLSGYYRGSGSLIKDLMVNDIENSGKWIIADSLGETGSVFGNETLFAHGIPDYLIGQEWIKTSTQSKTWKEGAILAQFTLTKDAVISVFHNRDIEPTPEWLAGFERKEVSITVSSPTNREQTLQLYEKSCTAGEEVILGVNTIDGNPDIQMYFVVAREKNETSSALFHSVNPSLKVYPSLCRNSATIEYALGRDQGLQLEIFNLNGKKIRTLDSGYKSTGSHKILLDISTFQAGMYLVRLVTSCGMQQQRFWVLR